MVADVPSIADRFFPAQGAKITDTDMDRQTRIKVALITAIFRTPTPHPRKFTTNLTLFVVAFPGKVGEWPPKPPILVDPLLVRQPHRK